MNLAQALKKCGIEVAKVTKRSNRLTLHVRILNTDSGEELDRWQLLMTRVLSASGSAKGWTVDVSKHFYVQGGMLRYLWRLVFTGNPEAGQRVLGEIALEVVRDLAGEVSEVPLVGRVNYVPDPSRGKIKGAHDLRSCEGLIATSMAQGGQPMRDPVRE